MRVTVILGSLNRLLAIRVFLRHVKGSLRVFLRHLKRCLGGLRAFGITGKVARNLFLRLTGRLLREILLAFFNGQFRRGAT